MTSAYGPVVRASADLRLLRAAVFTAACVALSAAAHLVTGDAPIPVWTLGVAAALVLAVAVPLAGRERTLPSIAAGLGLGQLALHTVFSLGQLVSARSAHHHGGDDDRMLELARGLLCNDRAASGLSVPQARRLLLDAGLGHHVTGAEAHAAPPAGGTGASALECLDLAVRGTLALLSGLTGPMLLGHLAAALAAGWLLRRGEAALWRLVRLSAVAVDELLLRALRDALYWTRVLSTPPTGDDRPAAAGAGAPALLPPEPHALRHSVVRRGPPARRNDLALTA